VKANPHPEICRIIRRSFEGAECASAGEIELACAAGFDTSRSVIAGPAKSARDLEIAVRRNVTVNLESPAEFFRLNGICETLRQPVRALLRVSFAPEAAGEAQISMAGRGKFGIAEEELVAQYSNLRSPWIEVCGIHSFNFSQSLNHNLVLENVRHTLQLAEEFSSALRFDLKIIDFGGGIGIAAHPGESDFNLSALAEGLPKALSEHPAASGAELLWESGRFLVGEAGYFCTEVLDIKVQRGHSVILTDGGMNAFLRPALQRINHKSWILGKEDSPAVGVFDIGGPLCTPRDLLATAVSLPSPAVGDYVIIGAAGAYGYSMSPHQFLSHPSPAEVLWEDGAWRLITPRGF
jgi:diaminopimelate decarboxylase